jgi:hypothetical protein
MKSNQKTELRNFHVVAYRTADRNLGDAELVDAFATDNVKNARKAMYAAAVKFKGIYQSFAVYELRGATQALKG